MYSTIFSTISTGLSDSQIDSMWYILKGASHFFQEQTYLTSTFNFINLVYY